MLSGEPFVPAYQEVEQRSEEGKEDDDQYPYDLLIAGKVIHEYTDQGHDGDQENENDHHQCDEQAPAEKEQKVHEC